MLKYGSTQVEIWDEVYPPQEESLLLLTHISKALCKGKKVLDYGTGCGIFAIAAAKNGAQVVAVDNNPHAIACAKHNAKSLPIDFRIGSNLSTVEKEKFDIIFASLPWHKGKPKDYLEAAFLDNNFQMRKTLFTGRNLKQGGVIFFTYSEEMQKEIPLESQTDLEVKNIRSVQLYLLTHKSSEF